MKIHIHKCPLCHEDYGTIRDETGMVLCTIRCKCQIKKMIIESILLIAFILFLCTVILGGKHETKTIEKSTFTAQNLSK